LHLRLNLWTDSKSACTGFAPASITRGIQLSEYG